MSQMEYHPRWDTEQTALETAKKTRNILESCPETTMMWIEHNKTKPKPFHQNFDMMTALLKQEVYLANPSLVSAESGGVLQGCERSPAEGGHKEYTHDDWLEDQNITGEYDAYLRGEI